MKLGELCDVVRGSSPRPRSDPRFYGGSVPRLMVADLTRDGKIVSAQIDTLTELGARQSRPMAAGDVVIAVSGAPGLPAILAHDACIHDGFVGLRELDQKRLDANFLYAYLTFIRETSSSQAVGAIFKNLTTDQIKGIEIPELALSEQRRIAEVLDRAEELQAKRRAALAQLEILTQSVYYNLFGNSSNPARKIGDLLESGVLLLHKDGNHGSLYPRADDFDEHGIPFLSAKAVSDDGLLDNAKIEMLRNDKAESLKIGWISKGDVLLAHNASVGKVALYDGRFEKALIGTSLTAFRPNPDALDSYYLAAALRSTRFQRDLVKNMGQTTRNQVPITAQRDLLVDLPPIELQREFARQIVAVEKLKATQRKSLAELDALFASLQHRAFRGEL